MQDPPPIGRVLVYSLWAGFSIGLLGHGVKRILTGSFTWLTICATFLGLISLFILYRTIRTGGAD